MFYVVKFQKILWVNACVPGKTLLEQTRNLNQSLKIISEDQLVNMLLFGFENFTLDTNANILRPTIEFLKAIERFNSLLF